VDTVSDIWPTADWHEREIYDMMGIRFNNHPDLRRILMWDGYPFFPLRKDFPLEGLPSEMPDVAFTSAAPMEGGPCVTQPSTAKEMGGHRKENTHLIFTSPTAPSIAPCIFPIRMRPTAHERQRRVWRRAEIS